MSLVKSVRNLDAKCEVQMCPFALFAADAKKSNHSKLTMFTMFTVAKYTVPLE